MTAQTVPGPPYPVLPAGWIRVADLPLGDLDPAWRAARRASDADAPLLVLYRAAWRPGRPDVGRVTRGRGGPARRNLDVLVRDTDGPAGVVATRLPPTRVAVAADSPDESPPTA